ncbi:MAG: type II toxin-antitoxin system HicA family toxin [Candidatus Woesearchaeota archaeon]
MKLPELKAIEVSKVLKKLGFVMKRQHGSHMIFEHGDGRTTVVPNHPSEFVDRHLLNKIIKHDLKIERKEFVKLLK